MLSDSHYARLRSDLEFDAQNLEAESWSVAVDQNYLKALNKEAVNRQDVIYGRQNQLRLSLNILNFIYPKSKSEIRFLYPLRKCVFIQTELSHESHPLETMNLVSLTLESTVHCSVTVS